MSDSTNDIIDKSLIEKAMTYKEYMSLFEELVKKEKTSGENQSLKLIEYTKMNLRRMRRLDKTTALESQFLSFLHQDHAPITFLVLSEAWCGDAAQNLPTIHKVAEAASWLDLKIILRDENPEVMNQFLTNGARSIPKLIALKTENLEVLGSWGPRPKTAQDMVMNFKKLPNGDYEEFVKQVQLWYAKDKTETLQKELLECLRKWAS